MREVCVFSDGDCRLSHNSAEFIKLMSDSLDRAVVPRKLSDVSIDTCAHEIKNKCLDCLHQRGLNFDKVNGVGRGLVINEKVGNKPHILNGFKGMGMDTPWVWTGNQVNRLTLHELILFLKLLDSPGKFVSLNELFKTK